MLVQAEVLPALSKEEVALPPIGRALADALVPSAVHSAGEHLAAGVNGLRRGSFSYDLRSAQDQAVYAAANGKVPDRPPPAVTPRQAAPPLTITVRPGGTEQLGKTPAGIDYTPPRWWNPTGDPSIPLPKAGKKGGYRDAKDDIWVRPRGDKMAGGKPNHWDVQRKGGRHKNITKDGREHH